MGYELGCKICPWAGGQGPQPEQDPACYFGETGQNMDTRINVHKSKFKSKLLRIREESAFYIHLKNKHSDVEIEGKPLDAFFEVNILKAYKKVLTRLVDEGINLISHNGPILTQKQNGINLKQSETSLYKEEQRQQGLPWVGGPVLSPRQRQLPSHLQTMWHHLHLLGLQQEAQGESQGIHPEKGGLGGNSI